MTEHWPHAVEVALLELVEFRLAALVIDGNAMLEEGLNVGKGIRVKVPVPDPILPDGPFKGVFEIKNLGVVLAGLLEPETLGGVFEAVSEGTFEG